jgi:acetyltransferase
LTDSTLKALSAILPPFAAIHNPVDMLASASPQTYADCLRLLLADPNVDAALVILPPPPMFKAEEVAEKLIETLRQFDKPVVVSLMGSTLVAEANKRFQRASVPTYPFPERAVSALSALFKRTEMLKRPLPPAERAVRRPADLTLSAPQLLTEYGVPTLPLKLARTAAEAVTIANEMGYPVVMKIASPDILHKSNVGGVILDIQDAASLSSAYAQMMGRVKAAAPHAAIEGVHIQKQIPTGQEVIVGMVRDPQFGALMMFGSGGVEVEGLKDVAFAMAPLNQAEAEDMIRKTWAGKKLKGFRNIPPADEQAVIEVLIKLSRLAVEHEAIEEIEVNPLCVLNKGAVAVDVRMKTK